MKKSFLKWSTCIAGMLLAFSLTSCVSESDETPEVPTGDGTLVININSTPVGAMTRSTSFTTDQSADEKKVKNLIVNVYNAEGTELVAQFVRDFTVGTTGLLDISTEQSVIEPYKFSDGEIVAGQKARVACNVSEETMTALKAAETFTEWNDVTTSIDAALVGYDGNDYDNTTDGKKDKSMDATKIPMYGEAVVAANTTGTRSFKIDVTVKHVVAKVTLNSLRLDVTGGDQLKVSRVFLINVAGSFNWNNSETFYVSSQANFFQGNKAADATDALSNPVATKQYRDYLSSAAINETLTSAGTSSLSTPHYFYAMPNLANATVDTRIVVEGYWTKEGETENTTTPCYYSLKLQNLPTKANPGSLTLGIQPNHNYKVNVVIKREGGDDAYSDQLGGSYTMDVTPTVADNWDGVDNNATFDEAGSDD